MERGQLFEHRYRVDALLGSGGFADVFDAWDTRDERAVALKVIRPSAAGGYAPDARARFRREALSLSRLRSASIIRLYAYGEAEGGELYMAFERLPGRDLHDVLADRGRVTARQAEGVLRQLLDALEHAHNAGLLHRDIKPENIRILSEEGDDWPVKLLDFGIVRPLAEGSPGITATGVVVGTPRYMSPEQLVEAPLSAASDIYSLGVVVFEMLVGSRHLHGSSWLDQLERMQSGHLFAAPGFEDVHEILRQVVSKMTARDITARATSIGQVRELLDIATAPTDKLPPPFAREQRARAAERAERLRKRDRRAMLLTSLIALGAASIGFAWCKDSPKPERRLTRSTSVPRPAPEPPRRPAMAAPAVDAGAVTDVGVGCDGTEVRTGMDSLEGGWDPAFRYVPTSYDGTTAMPLWLLFHDELNEPDWLLQHSTFDSLAEEKGFIIVAPKHGFLTLQPWQHPHEVAPQVREMAEIVQKIFCVDADRIYAVGHGDGGRMVELLTNEPWIAAAATHSFRQRDPRFKYIHARPQPAPFLLLSPGKSPIIPLEGGWSCTNAERQPLSAVERLWRDRNRCDEGSEESRRVGPDQTVCKRWRCKTPFESCVIDGGFSFPGLNAKHNVLGCDDGPVTSFDTPRHIWSFFERVSER